MKTVAFEWTQEDEEIRQQMHESMRRMNKGLEGARTAAGALGRACVQTSAAKRTRLLSGTWKSKDSHAADALPYLAASAAPGDEKTASDKVWLMRGSKLVRAEVPETNGVRPCHPDVTAFEEAIGEAFAPALREMIAECTETVDGEAPHVCWACWCHCGCTARVTDGCFGDKCPMCAEACPS